MQQPANPHHSSQEIAAEAARAYRLNHDDAGVVGDLVGIRVQPSGSVYRGRLTASAQGDRDVVVKVMRTGEGSIRERALLELARAHAVPGIVQLVSASEVKSLIILEDLGDGPSLADRLLGDDPAAATGALLRWVGAIAGMQIATSSLHDEFVERLTRLSGSGAPLADTTIHYADDVIAQLAPALARIGLALPSEAARELRSACSALAVGDGSAAPAGIVPGDTCPDNNSDRRDGMVLFDFEGAQYRHVAWEMAYLTVPWPTCWCSWAIPDSIAQAAIVEWRTKLAATFPGVGEPGFEIDLARATSVWAAQWVGHSLGPALDGDERPRFHEGVAPSRRATVSARLAVLANDPHDVCPALAQVARQALDHCAGQWGAIELAMAPAWRRRG